MRQIELAQAALTRVLGANAQKYAAISSQLGKSKTVRLAHHYFGKKVATNSDLTDKIDLIKVTDQKQEGIRSIDRGKVPAGEIFICTGVKLAYANAATSSNDIDTVRPSNLIFNAQGVAEVTVNGNDYPVSAQRIPNKVLNAEVSFKRGNNVYIDTLAENFFKETNEDRTHGVISNNASGVFLLENPIVFDEETMLQVTLQMPLNGTAGTLDHFFRVEWFGYAVVDL